MDKQDNLINKAHEDINAKANKHAEMDKARLHIANDKDRNEWLYQELKMCIGTAKRMFSDKFSSFQDNIFDKKDISIREQYYLYGLKEFLLSYAYMNQFELDKIIELHPIKLSILSKLRDEVGGDLVEGYRTKGYKGLVQDIISARKIVDLKNSTI